MEQIVDGLLKDFERGKLTRRQLVQQLAFGMAAGPAALASAQTKPAAPSTIPAPKAPTGWNTVFLDHISFAVADYRRSTTFYRDLLGWQVLHDDAQKQQCSMKIGNVGGIIIRNQAGYRGAFGDWQHKGTTGPTGVVDHISWGIAPWNTEKVRTELEQRGLKPMPDMDGAFQSFHVHDPDGCDLQISNQKDNVLL